METHVDIGIFRPHGGNALQLCCRRPVLGLLEHDQCHILSAVEKHWTDGERSGNTQVIVVNDRVAFVLNEKVHRHRLHTCFPFIGRASFAPSHIFAGATVELDMNGAFSFVLRRNFS
jgi:hypothetical protein